MQLAAEDPHAIVSFLGYACSRAVISSVIRETDTDEHLVQPLTQSILRERGLNAESASVVLAQAGWSQLDHAVRDLCADRATAASHEPRETCNKWRGKPDLVLVSIGGNDVGFSNVVKWAMAGTAVGKVRFLSGAVAPETMLSRARGEEDLNDCERQTPGRQCDLLTRFTSLAAAIENRLGLTDRSKVLIGSYPSPVFSETGLLCTAKSVNQGADSEYYISTTDRRLQRLHGTLFAEKQLNNALRDAISLTGWTWVDALDWSGAFSGHGICAKGGWPADTLKMPRKVRGEWTPISPAKIPAYATRQRWFRTFNDSILIQYYETRIPQLSHNPRQPVDYHYPAGISGFFHPTAEGQAVMADMLLTAARCKLAGREAKCNFSGR
jgi:lysophospholipase L1-like esterase